MKLLQNINLLSQRLRNENPLVHSITNYVTANDCANAILAVGGSPIMADDKKEVIEIVTIAKALVLNMGTLNERTIESMLVAGKQANKLQIPVILDPVGAGASSFRNDTVKKILEQVSVSVVRGNISEVSYLAGLHVNTKGVDASLEDNNDSVKVATKVANQLQCTVAITGAIDVIADGTRIVKIHNGTEKMSHVTGTGCMTSAILGAFHGVTEDGFLAAVAAIVYMGIAGEAAWETAGKHGLGSFHIGIFDALSTINTDKLKEMAKIEEL